MNPSYTIPVKVPLIAIVITLIVNALIKEASSKETGETLLTALNYAEIITVFLILIGFVLLMNSLLDR